MKTRQWAALIPLWAILTMFSVGLAEAANGTLKLTFKYKDPTTGVDQDLNYGFIYLHDATKPAPMEKYFNKADYILSGSLGYGKIVAYVPEGTYYIRVTQRKSLDAGTRRYGPPEAGDYSWFQTAPIRIVAGATLDLGTKYATPFGSTITISGTVRNSSGVPLAGRFVRATTVPCLVNQGCTDGGSWCEQYTNQCGPDKMMALEATDANGRYMLMLRNPGTYYLSTFSSWSTNAGYNPPAIIGNGYAPQPVTVQGGDITTVDLVSN